jgi:hypothetical protein
LEKAKSQFLRSQPKQHVRIRYEFIDVHVGSLGSCHNEY